MATTHETRVLDLDGNKADLLEQKLELAESATVQQYLASIADQSAQGEDFF